MRKTVLLSILCILSFLTCSDLQAQSNISYGIKGGLNISNSTHENMGSRTGYHLGVVVHKQYSNHFFLRSGIEFTAKGAEGKETWADISTEGNYARFTDRAWKYRLNYLQIPILAGYKFPLSNTANFVINAGPYLSYGIYASEKYSYLTSNNPLAFAFGDIYVEDVSKGFSDVGLHRFDFGVIGGIGLEYKRYTFNVNYEYGILNLMMGLYDGGNPSWKNQNLAISVGYFFRK